MEQSLCRAELASRRRTELPDNSHAQRSRDFSAKHYIFNTIWLQGFLHRLHQVIDGEESNSQMPHGCDVFFAKTPPTTKIHSWFLSFSFGLCLGLFLVSVDSDSLIVILDLYV